MAKRVIDYTPDPNFRTTAAGLARIQLLRRLLTRRAITPRERLELARLEETQATMEYQHHRSRRQAAKRAAKRNITHPET
jgi:hypothetical protein